MSETLESKTERGFRQRGVVAAEISAFILEISDKLKRLWQVTSPWPHESALCLLFIQPTVLSVMLFFLIQINNNDKDSCTKKDLEMDFSVPRATL